MNTTDFPRACATTASFMRMMISVFGDFSSLLCYLDDLLVFAPSEEEALKRLDIVFSRLRANNLKLAQKKCHFLHRSVRFLGPVVNSSGVSVDQENVKVISAFRKEDLMNDDGCTPSQQKVKYFLGMVVHYQHFIPGCSSIADLKSALLNSVVLAHPDFDRPFILSTDASLDGLGAVLSQVPASDTHSFCKKISHPQSSQQSCSQARVLGPHVGGL